MSYFRQNMRILHHTHSEIIDSLAGSELSPAFRICNARNGAPILIANNGEQPQDYVHCPDDPMEEAERLVSDLFFLDADATILMGSGLGYLVKAIRKKLSPGHDLFVLELIPEFLQAAICSVDLTEELSDNRIHFSISPAASHLLNLLKRQAKSPLQRGRIQRLLYYPAAKHRLGTYLHIQNEIFDHIDGKDDRNQNIKAPVRIQNIFRNIPHLMESASIAHLKDEFQNIPAIIIAGGPSMGRCIGNFTECKDRCLLISVDTALKAILPHNIFPDIVVSTDPTDINLKKFVGLDPNFLRTVNLVFDPEANHCVPGLFEGKKFFAPPALPISKWLAGLCDTLPDMPDHIMASQLAFQLAAYLGCHPIILTGFDFSFPNRKHHVSGAALTWMPDFQSDRFKSIDSVDGGKVLSADGFITAKRLLENDVIATNSQVFNCSEGGASINGAPFLPFSMAMEAYLIKHHQDMGLRIEQIHKRNYLTSYQDIREGVIWFENELNSLMTFIAPLMERVGDDASFGPETVNIQSLLKNIVSDIESHGTSSKYHLLIALLGYLRTSLLFSDRPPNPKNISACAALLIRDTAKAAEIVNSERKRLLDSDILRISC